MPYIQADKSKGIEEEYIPDWVENINVQPFTPKQIPGINEDQINQAISIET